MFCKRKSVVIEAVQWTGENFKELFNFVTLYIIQRDPDGSIVVQRYEGELRRFRLDIGDYVIKDRDGYHSIKKCMFEQNYDECTKLARRLEAIETLLE